jgi:hypothetical protein
VSRADPTPGQHALDLLIALAERRRNTARAILDGKTESTTTISTPDQASIVELPKRKLRPRIHPDVAAYEADVYKQGRNARAAKRGGLR